MRSRILLLAPSLPSAFVMVTGLVDSNQPFTQCVEDSAVAGH
jgi:hypothetical protein